MSLKKFLFQRLGDAPHAGQTVSSLLVDNLDKTLEVIVKTSKEFGMRPSLVEASTITKFGLDDLLSSISRSLKEKSVVMLVISDVDIVQKVFDLVEMWKGHGFIDNDDYSGRLLLISTVGEEHDNLIKKISDYVYKGGVL